MEYDINVNTAHPAVDGKTRSYNLLNLAGKDVIDQARSSTYAEDEAHEGVNFLKLKALCEPKKNLTMLRHRFNSRTERENDRHV